MAGYKINLPFKTEERRGSLTEKRKISIMKKEKSQNRKRWREYL